MICPHCLCQHNGVPAHDHDRRVTELLTHNNELLEKYRAEKALRKENELRAEGLALALMITASMGALIAKDNADVREAMDKMRDLKESGS